MKLVSVDSIYDKKCVGSEFELTNSKMECAMRFRVFPRNVEYNVLWYIRMQRSGDSVFAAVYVGFCS